MISAFQEEKPISCSDTPVTSVPATAPARRRHTRLLYGALVVAIGIYVWITVGNAWREATLREAYLPEIEAMARRAPNDGRLLALLGGRLMEAHEHPKAVLVLQHALLVGEQKEPVWLGAAAATAAVGDRERCLGLLRLGLETHPEYREIRAALQRAEQAGPGASIGALALAVSPRGPQPLVTPYSRPSFLSGLTKWWGRRNPEKSGFATRLDWVARQPRDSEAQRLWGLALVRNRREIEAGPVFRRAVELAPRSPAAHLALADYEAHAGLFASAAFQYIAALKLHRDGFPALMGLCRISLKDDLRYGTGCFRRATEVEPRSPDAWVARGLADYQQGEHKDKEALEAFQTAARLDPARTDFFPQWAYVLAQTGRYDDAESLLRRRLKTAPSDVEAHFQLASVLMDVRPTPERESEAETQAREAMQLSPQSAVAKVLLAKGLLHRRQVNEAIGVLEQAMQAEPSNLKALNLLARAYARAGRAVLAERISRRARAAFDDHQRIMVLESRRGAEYLDPAVHRELATLYARTRQRDKALFEQQTVRALRKDPQQVTRELQRFRSDLQAVHLDH